MSTFSPLLLLILSFALLSLWSSTFKLAGNRWRFELFSLDFAVGAVLIGLTGAYTFGLIGSDLGFQDHILIASRTNQAYAIASGCLFAFANMLLLAAVSLLGLSVAYPISIASALLVLSAVEFSGAHALFLSGAIILAIVTIFLEARAASRGADTLPAVSLPSSARRTGGPSGSKRPKKKEIALLSNSAKGVLVGIVSGLGFGTVFPFLHSAIGGEFSLGPYAGFVLFALGALGGTVILEIYFMNFAVHGGPIGITAYFRGGPMQHLLGLVGGALCGAGILMAFSVSTMPPEAQPELLWQILAPLASGLIPLLLGLTKWREHSGAPGSVTRSLLIATFLLAAGVALYALALSKPVAPAL